MDDKSHEGKTQVRRDRNISQERTGVRKPLRGLENLETEGGGEVTR